MKKLEKKSEITEDDLRSGEKELQKVHDKYIKTCLLYTSRCV